MKVLRITGSSGDRMVSLFYSRHRGLLGLKGRHKQPALKNLMRSKSAFQRLAKVIFRCRTFSHLVPAPGCYILTILLAHPSSTPSGTSSWIGYWRSLPWAWSTPLDGKYPMPARPVAIDPTSAFCLRRDSFFSWSHLDTHWCHLYISGVSVPAGCYWCHTKQGCSGCMADRAIFAGPWLLLWGPFTQAEATGPACLFEASNLLREFLHLGNSTVHGVTGLDITVFGVTSKLQWFPASSVSLIGS